MNLAIKLLKISRPGLWFATLWLYLLPTASVEGIIYSFPFWLGLIYVCFPLNFMVYGWNDKVDYEADKHNKRKGNFLFGAKASDQLLSKIQNYIIPIQIVFFIPLIYIGNWRMALLLMLLVGVLYLYNDPKVSWKSKPPLELSCQFGYLLLVPFSILLNDLAQVSLWLYGYLALFAIQSHLIGEVMDIEPDRKAKKYTTATQIGMVKTKLLIIALVSIEVFIIFFIFSDLIFGLMLLGALLWFIIDLVFVFKNNQYSLAQMKFFGYSSNIVGFMSMSYVWFYNPFLS